MFIDKTQLSNLNGLENITYIGTNDYDDIYYVQYNPKLENIDALQNASSAIGVEVSIISNPKLVSLKGLKSMNPEIYNFYLFGNESLLNMEGLENIQQIESFYIIIVRVLNH